MKLFSILKIILINLLIFTVLGEVVIRIFSPIPKQVIRQNTSLVDSKIGWVSKENYQIEKEVKDALGNVYHVNYQTEKDGFRSYGDVNSENPKLLFIGDSFTQAVEVSNEKCFYNLIKDSLEVEIFAYGVSGFSTLQEFLILEKFYDQIQPDYIIWQTCANDFLDNHFDLMIECNYQIKEMRPYLNPKGEVIYRTPTGSNLAYNLRNNSALYFNIEALLNKGAETVNLKTPCEELIPQKELEYIPFKESYAIIDLILEKANKKVNGRSKMLAFSTHNYQPQANFMRRAFLRNDFTFIDEVANNLGQAKKSKQNINSNDNYHWNENGHKVVAKALLQGFKSNQIFEKENF